MAVTPVIRLFISPGSQSTWKIVRPVRNASVSDPVWRMSRRLPSTSRRSHRPTARFAQRLP